jgi:NAD(P)-dependent dehydrogenase (short-subunit alcohol dehydrogenase family)
MSASEQHLESGANPRAVVISGASTGMGRATALHLNSIGYLVFAGIRKPADGDALVRAARDPATLVPLQLDITSNRDIQAAVTSVAEHLTPGGRLVGLFSNAGIAGYHGDVSCEGTATADLDRMMSTNFAGAVQFVQAFLPMLRRSKGTIVVNSAMMAHLVVPFSGGYASSKAALEAWATSLRREVGPLGVRVVIMRAAAVSTALEGRQRPDLIPIDNPYPQQRALVNYFMESMKKQAGKRVTDPQRVAELVARALDSPRPAPIQIVGGGARALSLLGSMPLRLQDAAMSALVRRSVGYSKRASALPDPPT